LTFITWWFENVSAINIMRGTIFIKNHFIVVQKFNNDNSAILTNR